MSKDRKSTAAQARSIVRLADKATLATLIDPAGDPYTSMVMMGCDQTGAPLLLLSDLAQHTQNIADDPRASIAIEATNGYNNPLTGPRLSLLGRLGETGDDALLDRYLRKYADAADYLALGDFHLFRLAIERAHIVAGFGAIRWLDAAEITIPPAPALAEAEADILIRMNDDHGDALAFYAGAGKAGLGDWTMTGIDPEGFDLIGPAGRVRHAFDSPIDGPASARKSLAAMARSARSNSRG